METHPLHQKYHHADERGMKWWNSLSRHDRAFWLDVAGSARPVDAWRMYCALGINRDENKREVRA